MSTRLRTIILAAGKGTRFKSALPKVLHELGGRPALHYVLDVAEQVGSLKTFVVAGHKADQVAEAVGPRAAIVLQPEQRGTAHAVKMCAPYFRGFRGDVLVMCGDTPLLDKAVVRRLVARHRSSRAVATVLTVELDDPAGYGRIIRDAAGRMSAIREHRDAAPEERAVREINTGVYCFDAAHLFGAVDRIRANPGKKEFYLTDIVELFLAGGKGVEAFRTDDAAANIGLNTRADLAMAAETLRRRTLARLMDGGVTIMDPATTYVEYGVSVGQDTVIYPCTYIHGGVRIGRGCSVGPFARLRPGTRLGNGVSVGNFAEVSRSVLGDGVNMKHFSFLGDAVVGKAANIGCGAVTANYDGKNKSRTVIGAGAFIGCDTVLVAPVSVGAGAKVGAGSVVTAGRNIPPRRLAVGMPARVIKRLS